MLWFHGGLLCTRPRMCTNVSLPAIRVLPALPVCRVEGRCQPNFRQGVAPDPTQSCGPYRPLPVNKSSAPRRDADKASWEGSRQHGQRAVQQVVQRHHRQPEQQWPSEAAHDTIAMVRLMVRLRAPLCAACLCQQATQPLHSQGSSQPWHPAKPCLQVAVSADGAVAAGASSNGAIHKVPGRVGDAAVPGGGAYADNEVGGCGSTGGLPGEPGVVGCGGRALRPHQTSRRGLHVGPKCHAQE